MKPTNPSMSKEQEKEVLLLLRAAMDALRSYQYGNASTELAEEIADKIEITLAEIPFPLDTQ
jgi:hypothetical protein